MFHLRRLLIAAILIVASWFALTALHQHLEPSKRKSDEQREDARWIASSKYWLDRNACRWMGLCGLAHYHPDPPAGSRRYRARVDSRIDLKRRGQRAVEEEVEGEEHDTSYRGWGDGFGQEGKMSPDDFQDDERVLQDVPQFVLDAAPLIHLYSKEEFWPSDIAEHLMHTEAYTNHTTLNMSGLTVHNLHEANEGRRGRYVFMQSEADVESRPSWLGSSYNMPKPYPEDDEQEEEEETQTEFFEAEVTKEDRETWFDPYGPEGLGRKVASPLPSSLPAQPQPRRRSPKSRQDTTIMPPFIAKPTPAGRSDAPVILILVDKGHGILDAFWFYFYSYNLGTTVLNIRFGNHIGDWEHSLIRFHNGVPKAVFFSAHSGGTAYSYNAVEKGKGPGRKGRPVLYSAFGSHAMYAMPGKHPYILPFGLLADVTDKGPLWDPALNYYAYHFNATPTHDADAKSFSAYLRNKSMTTNLPLDVRRNTLQPANRNPAAPTGWFWFTGHWGDKFYELWDWRQWRFVGQYHYVNGPLGPRFKNLGRSKVCQSGFTCTILDSIEAGKKSTWLGKRSLGMKRRITPRSERVGERDDVE